MEQPTDYTFYTATDFIADHAFLQWVKYPDAASDAWWQSWIAAHPHKLPQIEEARAFIVQLQFAEQLPDAATVAASLTRNLSLIAAAENTVLPAGKKRPVRKLLWWAAAAAIIAGIITTAKYLLSTPEIIKVEGYADGVRTVWLPDSSLIRLNAGAQLSYRNNWKPGTKREI